MARHLPVTTAATLIPPHPTLELLQRRALQCTACPLFARASRTVFGEGDARATVCLVGEQPGDVEDRTGRPFVGPAGAVLNEALEAAGVPRAKTYVTNVVKHFKWEPRGKRRIHSTPNRGEVTACMPWLLAELSIVRPKALVCLGSTAAAALLGAAVRVTRDRGKTIASDLAPCVVATIHPSAILRKREQREREAEMSRFVEDLRAVAPFVSDGP